MSLYIQKLPQSDLTFDVRNQTGVTIVKGSLLYISGFDTASGRVLVGLADSSSSFKPSILVVDVDIPNNANGTGYVNRLVTGIDTSAATAVGDAVYLSPSNPGQFVFVVNPGHLVGVLEVKHPTDGQIRFFLSGAGGGVSGFSGVSGYSGKSGFSGISGWSGVSGASGFSSFSGFSGLSGFTGQSGFSGASGFSGQSGFSGGTGSNGSSGFSGFSGGTGSNGSSGFSGQSGFSGVSGWSGIGFSGPSGPSGPSGFSGFSGQSGFSGAGFSGPSGPSGPSGFSGDSGLSGFSSNSGVSGFSGTSGMSGSSGASGTSGQVGPSGFSGASGFSSLSGFSGFSSDSGISGYSGASGYSGLSGSSGFSGTGQSGFSGQIGSSGFSGISGFSSDSGQSGFSGSSGFSGTGLSGFSGAGASGFSGISGSSGFSSLSGASGVSGFSSQSGQSGFSGFSGLGINGSSGFSGFSGATGAGIVEQTVEVVSATTGITSPTAVKVGKLNTLAFQPAQDNAVDFVFEIPNDLDITRDVIVSLAYNMSSTNGGNVKLRLDYEVVNDGQSSAPGANTGSLSPTLSSLANVGIKAETSFTIPNTDLTAVTDSIHFSLYRLGTTDTHTGAWRLETINIRYVGFGAPVTNSGMSGFSGAGVSGFSGFSGISGTAGSQGLSGISGFSGGGGGGSVGANYPSWTKVTKTFSDLSTGATTNNIEILSLPAGGVIHAVKIKHMTSFTGGSISAYTVSIGIAGVLAKYATAFDVFQSTGSATYQLSDSVGGEDHSSATSIRIAAISTGANLSSATAGSVDVWLLTSVAV